MLILSDQEILQQQQNMVNLTATRTLSIPVGQGIFEFGTRTTKIVNTWDIPLIELTVKVVPGNTKINAQVAPEAVDWPCFHNGVSAALSISPDCKGIDSSWILFNRPNQLNPEHGGFLLGLGLTGHLRNLLTYHAFPYMEPRHDYTSIGLLLGLACSYTGSGDLLITKVLSLHTHALLPLGSMELNASPMIQSAALVGLGLVYVGSKNIRMAEIALQEIGRREMQGVDGFGEYIETYSFSASVAFGLIMLGKGHSGEVDRRMLGQLRRCISGDAPIRDGSTPITDTTLTAPGATLALGFMYLKTNRQDIADMLEIPQSPFALEHIRPDQLLLRTFSRALIMWDTTAPTLEWIEAQLPAYIQKAHKGHKRSSTMELNSELAYFNIIAGACFAIGVKYAGTAAEIAYDNLFIFHGVLNKAASSHSQTYEGKIRRTTARQGLNIIILAIASIMSGTGELRVLRRFRIAHGQEGTGITSGTHMALHMAIGLLFCGRGHYTLGNSNLAIAAMAISFFPRFSPNTNDNKAYPQALRQLWALAVEPRCLITRDVDTGETIYLPIKIKTRDDTTGIIRSQGLISPTLVAPFDTILSIEVDSPRYWPIIYDLTSTRDRQALVRTRTIHVKRKAGYLEYNDDPKGNRSIFVRAGSMTGFDLHYDLISPACPPTIPSGEVLELIMAHSGDPGLVGLARLFDGEDGGMDRFVQTVLLECLSMDKVGMLGVYLRLLRYGDGGDIMEDTNQIGFMRHFYGTGVWDVNYTAGAAGERKLALLRSSFLGSLARKLAMCDEDAGIEARQAYWREGRWDVQAIDLAAYLARNNVPPRRILEPLRIYVRSTEMDGADGLEMRVREVTARYAQVVESSWDLEAGVDVGKRMQWKMDSLLEAIRSWRE
jgi:anaphase-promoting complex subunit 1